MGGGAWPFLVGGAICLVNSVNERDLSLLTSYVEVCDALRCSGPHARYTDVFNEYIALADRPGKSLKFHRDGDRSLQLLVLNEEFLSQRVLEIVGREANGGRRCVPVGCGTALAGLPIDSGRGPVRIGAAAKAWAVDRPVEMPSCRLWLAARAVTACLGTCALPAPACGHPIRPVLKHGPRSLTCVRVNGGAKPEETLVEARSDTDVQIVRLTWVGRCGCFVEPCHGIESSKWAIFGKQNWRCGMNRKPGYGAKLRANLEPTKGVGRLRQQDGGHGSRNPLRSVLPTLETTQSEVGSSGWKSTARRAVSGAPPAALENPEDRVPPTPGRTHNRIRSPRIGSEGWARGSQSRTRRLSADCSSCFRGESGSPRAGRGTDWERLFRGPSPGVEQPTQNCALNVKVKKFNQARVNGGSNYDSLKRGNAPLFGPKACFGGPIRAEDIVSQAFIATLLFDPSMSALPIIVKQNSPSVGLFTHQ
ncbi:hypothetical protein LXL04_039425 [Taraxacum kok-saghyz]